MSYKPKKKNIKNLKEYLSKNNGRQKDKCVNIKGEQSSSY